MQSSSLLELLQKNGNMMSIDELQTALFTLTGEQDFKNALPEYISAEEYAQKVLGFEEIEDDEDLEEGEEEEDGEETQTQGKHVAFNLGNSPMSANY